MLRELTERTADWLVEITEDPDIKELKKVGRDWASFLEFLSGLFEMLMPIFEKCLPTTPPDIIARAIKWEEVIGLNRRSRRRKIGMMENILLARWERQVSRGIDEDVGDEFNNGEVCEAILHTFATAEPHEIDELRAETARLREGT